jgi:hypothetical protein
LGIAFTFVWWKFYHEPHESKTANKEELEYIGVENTAPSMKTSLSTGMMRNVCCAAGKSSAPALVNLPVTPRWFSS